MRVAQEIHPDPLARFRVERDKQPVPDVYAITPPRDHPVALYTQQARALNLVWRLSQEPGVEGKQICVVLSNIVTVTLSGPATPKEATDAVKVLREQAKRLVVPYDRGAPPRANSSKLDRDIMRELVKSAHTGD